MRLFRFDKFKQEKLLNENVAQAKKLAKEIYTLNKSIVKSSNGKYKTDPDGLIILDRDGYPVEPKDMDQNIVNKAKDSLDQVEIKDEEIKNTERSKAMEKIRLLVGKKQGYTYMFLYFHIVELVPIEQLEIIMGRLKSNGDLLQKLRRNISNYIDVNVPNNSEQLVDDLDDIDRYRKAKKFINEFTSELKDDYEKSPPYLKDKLVDVATAFDDIGKVDGKIDKSAQKATQKRFFDKIKRHRTVREMLVAAENFLKAEANEGYTKFLKAVQEVNKKYKQFGADILFDENEVLVIELKSYQATNKLCANTSWCIKDLYYWNSYVGGDTVYNRQYIIVNYNLPSSDNKSMIGVTIAPGQRIYAAHLKNDADCAYNFKEILTQFENDHDLPEPGVLWYFMKPMDEKDIEMKKRRVSANRNVVKKDITLEDLKQYIIEDGADPNAENGAALDNAVVEDNFDKVEFLLDVDASPNLRTEFNATVNKVKSFDILKLLLNKGAELTPHAFRPMMDDAKAVEFCLQNGMNPDLGKGLPLRQAIKRGKLDLIKVFIKYGTNWGLEDGKAQRVAFEKDRMDMAKFLLENGYTKSFNVVMDWIGLIKSVLPTKRRYELLQLCQDWIDKGIVTMEQTGYKMRVDGKISSVTYADIVKRHGNYMNYVIDENPSLHEFKK